MALGSVQPSVMICVGISLLRIGCCIQFELLIIMKVAQHYDVTC